MSMDCEKSKRAAVLFVGTLCGLAAVGCGGSRETANISFSYVIEKEKGLPSGMNTIAIVPAKIGETTDPKLVGNVSDDLAVAHQRIEEQVRNADHRDRASRHQASL